MEINRAAIEINKVPEFRAFIDSGTDWVTVSGFVLTLIVFVIGTILTIRNFNETIKGQKEIAREGSLKSSRQNWINDLRDTCSAYVAAVLNVQRLWNLREGTAGSRTALAHEHYDSYVREHSQWAAAHVEAMKEVRCLGAKIELLLNPNEDDSKVLIAAVSTAMTVCDNVGNHAEQPCNEIVERTQIILKQEWERAKAGK